MVTKPVEGESIECRLRRAEQRLPIVGHVGQETLTAVEDSVNTSSPRLPYTPMAEPDNRTQVAARRQGRRKVARRSGSAVTK